MKNKLFVFVVAMLFVCLVGVSLVYGELSKSGSTSAKVQKTVLILGDSHLLKMSSGFYGQELYDFLSQKYLKVISLAVCDADSRHYLDGLASTCTGGTTLSVRGINEDKPNYKLKYLVQQHNPDIFIVSLGTAFLSGKNVEAYKAKELLSDIPSGKACYWVGAPVSTADNSNPSEINTELKKIVEPKCTFIDAVALTKTENLEKDGVSFKSGGKEWAQGVYNVVSGITASITSTEKLTVSQPVVSGQKTKKTVAAGCANLESCEAIDTVWTEIAVKLKGSWDNKVYDPKSKKYVLFDDYYYDTKTDTTTETITVVSKKDYDQYFLQYGTSEIPASVLKALATKESSLTSLLVGTTGEVGLFQFTFNTAKGNGIFEKLTRCCKVIDAKGNDICLNEIAANGGKLWKVGSPFQCNPSNDDRFDPELNIKSGAKLLKSSYDYFASRYNIATTEDKLKLTIAAHNIGKGGLETYVKKVKNDGQPITWEDVNNQMETMGQHSSTNKLSRKTAMANYVSYIFSLANTYKTQLGS